MSTLEAYALDDHAPLQVCHPKIKGIQAVGSIYHHGLPRACLDENRVLGASYTCSLIATMLNESLRGSPQRCKSTPISSLMYSDQQNRVLLVIVFIQKTITYSCVNEIQICKHESCSIQHIEPCDLKKKLQINRCLVVIGFQS
jgi:hypothetical protein